MIKKFLKFLVILSAGLCIGLTAGYFGYLLYLEGRAFGYSGNVNVFDSATAEWRAFEKRYRLKKNDIIRTGMESDCELIFGKSAEIIVKIDENSELKVVDRNPTVLELMNGRLLAAFSRPSCIRNFTVKTPNGISGVRGTGWSIALDRKRNMAVNVFEGRVKFAESELLYEETPYIARDGQSLEITKEASAVRVKYGKIDKENYTEWNEWMRDSARKLSKMGIINQMAEARPEPYPVWQNGISYGSWQPAGYMSIESEMSLPKMEKDTNASWVNIITAWYQKDLYSTDIAPDPEKTPTDESLAHVLEKARKLGMHIMLTPQLDLIGRDGSAWRAEISFSDDNGWESWFKSYEAFILHHADMAGRFNVEMLNIGTELSLASTKRPDKWVELIDKIREVYGGRLVYTANWDEEYKDIKFWDSLDYAGISAFFPLSETERPSLFRIRKAWQALAGQIAEWQKTHKKPVIFTEIGYRSIQGAAKEPWDYSKTGQVDLKQQYNCYKAAFETFREKEWFYGMYWWLWDTSPYIHGKYHRGYTPNDKPAAKLVSVWYSKPDPHKYKSLKRILKEKLGLSGS